MLMWHIYPLIVVYRKVLIMVSVLREIVNEDGELYDCLYKFLILLLLLILCLNQVYKKLLIFCLQAVTASYITLRAGLEPEL